MSDEQFRRMVNAACVILLGLPIVIALICLVLLFITPAHAEPAPQEDQAELMLIPAAVWLKVEQALVYWHEEALRLKAMKACS